MNIVFLIILLITCGIAVILGASASVEAQDSLKWSIISIVCGLYILGGIIILLYTGKATSANLLEVIIFIVIAVVEISFGLNGINKLNKKRQADTKKLWIDKQAAFLSEKNRLTSEIEKLRLEQQKILSRWTSSPYGGESEGVEQSRK